MLCCVCWYHVAHKHTHHWPFAEGVQEHRLSSPRPVSRVTITIAATFPTLARTKPGIGAQLFTLLGTCSDEPRELAGLATGHSVPTMGTAVSIMDPDTGLVVTEYVAKRHVRVRTRTCSAPVTEPSQVEALLASVERSLATTYARQAILRAFESMEHTPPSVAVPVTSAIVGVGGHRISTFVKLVAAPLLGSEADESSDGAQRLLVLRRFLQRLCHVEGHGLTVLQSLINSCTSGFRATSATDRREVRFENSDGPSADETVQFRGATHLVVALDEST